MARFDVGGFFFLDGVKYAISREYYMALSMKVITSYMRLRNKFVTSSDVQIIVA